MSSSSSSEWYFDEGYKYSNETYEGTQFAMNYSNPYYPTMGHPIIYYAHVPPANRRQRCKKNNPNCFVKAFRWYTQEHVPLKKNEYCATDRPGFAYWLDKKYDEFVRSSQMDHSSYKLKLKQTSTFQVTKKPTMTHCENCATIKTVPNKSVWGKRRSFDDRIDVKEKELQNFEYILQPKDLARPASDCCHPTPTSCCNRSNTTLTSTDTREKKTTTKSQSLCSLHQENRKPIDLVTNEAAIKTQGDNYQSNNKKYRIRVSKSRESSKSDTARKSWYKKNYVDKICQCPEEKNTNVDAKTQYENMGKQETKLVCERCAASCSRLMPVTRQTSQVLNKQSNMGSILKRNVSRKSENVICECFEERILADVKGDEKSQCLHPNILCDCTERNVKKGSQTQYQKDCRIHQDTEKNRTLLNALSSHLSMTLKIQGSHTTKDPERSNRICDSVQTSDHSIHLEKETGQDYPLFMKIICADKLSEECRCDYTCCGRCSK